MLKILISAFVIASFFSHVPATTYAFFGLQNSSTNEELARTLPTPLTSFLADEDNVIELANPLRFLSGVQNSDQQIKVLLQQIARLQAILNIMLTVPNNQYSFPSSGLNVRYYSNKEFIFNKSDDPRLEVFSESWVITWPGLQTKGGTFFVLPASDEILLSFIDIGMSNGLLEVKDMFAPQYTEIQNTLSTAIQDTKIGGIDFKNYQLLSNGQPILGFISAKREINNKLYYIALPYSGVVALQNNMGVNSPDDTTKTIYTLMTNITVQ